MSTDASDGQQPSQPDSLLSLAGVGKRFGGVHALSDITAQMRLGEHVAIVGDNGAGKSTLVKILSGVIQVDSGRIWLGGTECHFHDPLAARNAGVETVFQDLALVNNLNVAENMFLGRELFALRFGALSVLARQRMTQRTRTLLSSTGVRVPNIRTPVGSLSGGQRQGVAIARAAGWGSRLIIMDEPTAALGVQETHAVEEIIRGLKKEGTSVILVSHNLRQVFTLVDTIWVLRHGQLAGTRDRRTSTPDEIVKLITGSNLVGTDYA